METRMSQLKKMTRRPSTPGDVLGGILEENGIAQGKLADAIGVSRLTVNQLVRNRRNLTADMAHRLGRYFGNGPALWLNLQRNVDLWDALHMDVTVYAHIQPLKAQVA